MNRDRYNELRRRLLARKDHIDNMLKAVDSLENTRKEGQSLELVDDATDEIALNLADMGFDDYYVWHELYLLNRKLETMQFTCRYSEQDSGLIRMMVAATEANPDSRALGIREIRDFTNKATELIVIDPYIFGGESDEVSTLKYIEDFKKSTRIDQASLKKLHIIFSSKHGQTGSIKSGIRRLAHVSECEYSERDSDQIHDRIWIRDKSEAIVIGTSLGGLGNRVCFILELPKYDLMALLDYLRGQNLLYP